MALIPISFTTQIDSDKIISKLEYDVELVNTLIRTLGINEYNIVLFLVKEGMKSLVANVPSYGETPEIDDDPFAKPNPDAGLSTPNFTGDDPYARPAGWGQDKEII